MTDSWTNSIDGLWIIAQAQPGVAPAPAAQPVNAVGMPGGATQVPSDGTQQPLGPTGAGAAPAGGMGPLIWLLPVMLVVMILMSTLTGRKDKKRRAELLSSIKKQDKVQTLGGLIGTIVEMSDDEVVLRIEEGRIRVTKSAIQQVISSRDGKSASVAEVKGEAKASAVN